MRFGVLGPLHARIDGRDVPLKGPRQAKVLAVLLVESNRVVPMERLVGVLWDGDPPTTAVRQVQDVVSGLRRTLRSFDAPSDLISTERGGYRIRLETEQLDLLGFEQERSLGERTAATDPEAAVTALRRALGRWRGAALADISSRDLAGDAARLNQLRLAVHKQCLGLELELARHAEAADELTALLREHPYDEQVAELAMLALYRSGRRSQALELYQGTRRTLVREVGVEPSPRLQQLHGRVLNADPALDAVPPNATATDAATRAAPAAPAAAPTPADAGTPPVPRQLSSDLADFTGRAELVHRLETLLAGGGPRGGPLVLSALNGAGGVGKTSLAVHVAHRVQDAFPDGQLQVDLHGVGESPANPFDVLARFLRGLGVPGPEIPADPEERSALFRSTVAGRRILLLLDNVKDAAQVRPLLPGSGSCAVLITSRSALPGLDGAHRIPVDILTGAEALELFTGIVGAEAVAADPEAVAAVLRVCAGLPLAIRIAASRLACQPGWTVRTLADQLGEENRLLDRFQVEDRAVRSSFAVGFNALDPQDVRAFGLLGLWSGPDITPPAASALLAASPQTTRRTLDTLARAHLIQAPQPHRYAFHDLLRVYAAERAAQDHSPEQRLDAVTRLTNWFAHTADHAADQLNPERGHKWLEGFPPCPEALTFSDRDTALRWFRQERANLAAAVAQAAEQRPTPPAAWVLPACLHHFQIQSGYWSDLEAADTLGLAAARRLGDARGQAWMLIGLSIAQRMTTGMPAALESARLALEQAEATGEPNIAVTAMTHYALSLHSVERYEEAIHWYERALPGHALLGRPGFHAATLNNLGFAHHELRRYEQAVAHYESALALLRAAPHSAAYVQAGILDGLGRAFHGMDRPAEAIASLEQAVALRRQLGDVEGRAASLDRLGDVHHTEGQHSLARDSWQEALEALHGREHPLLPALTAKLGTLADA